MDNLRTPKDRIEVTEELKELFTIGEIAREGMVAISKYFEKHESLSIEQFFLLLLDLNKRVTERYTK